VVIFLGGEGGLNSILAENTCTADIPTGGGVLILGRLLDQALIVKGAALYKPNDPALVNMQELWKWRQHTIVKKEV